MKQKQYVIEKISNGHQAQWGNKTILFDSQEEVEEMIYAFPKFFAPKSYEIKSGIYFIDSSINYKDLKELPEFKKEMEEGRNNISARTLQEVLDTDLSPENMGNYTPNQLATYLVENEIVKSTADVNRIVIEGIQRALNEDDEFPIHYYTKEEPMSETGKVTDAGDCLTDEYIENNMNI